MNKDRLKNLVGYRIRIRPIARRPGDFDELPVIDDDWIISNVDTDHVELTNVRTGHNAVLGLDHIHSFLSDPGRDNSGIKYGFLQLRVQLSLLPAGSRSRTASTWRLGHAHADFQSKRSRPGYAPGCDSPSGTHDQT